MYDSDYVDTVIMYICFTVRVHI